MSTKPIIFAFLLIQLGLKAQVKLPSHTKNTLKRMEKRAERKTEKEANKKIDKSIEDGMNGKSEKKDSTNQKTPQVVYQSKNRFYQDSKFVIHLI